LRWWITHLLSMLQLMCFCSYVYDQEKEKKFPWKSYPLFLSTWSRKVNHFVNPLHIYKIVKPWQKWGVFPQHNYKQRSDVFKMVLAYFQTHDDKNLIIECAWSSNLQWSMNLCFKNISMKISKKVHSTLKFYNQCLDHVCKKEGWFLMNVCQSLCVESTYHQGLIHFISNFKFVGLVKSCQGVH
jgi:hypothetical protein